LDDRLVGRVEVGQFLNEIGGITSESTFIRTSNSLMAITVGAGRQGRLSAEDKSPRSNREPDRYDNMDTRASRNSPGSETS
jgi:hypothetical protein